MAITKHNFSRGPYVIFPISMNMHEFKNIDDVWGLQAIACNRIVAFLYSLLSVT